MNYREKSEGLEAGAVMIDRIRFQMFEGLEPGSNKSGKEETKQGLLVN